MIEVRIEKTTSADDRDAWVVIVARKGDTEEASPSERETFTFATEAQAQAFAKDYAEANQESEGVPHNIVP